MNKCLFCTDFVQISIQKKNNLFFRETDISILSCSMNHYYYNFPYTRYTRNKYILPGRSLLTRKEEIHPLV